MIIYVIAQDHKERYVCMDGLTSHQIQHLLIGSRIIVCMEDGHLAPVLEQYKCNPGLKGVKSAKYSKVYVGQLNNIKMYLNSVGT